jgi:hypothetical protein
MWLSNFKKALILQEFSTVEHLVAQMPAFDSLEEMEQAAYLLQNAMKLLESERSNTLHSLTQLKSTIDFLKATENTPASTINLKL